MAVFVVRYDLRRPSFAETPMDELYRVALEQAGYADEHGLDAVVLSEHHGVDDGYLPSPITLAAAVAARTRRIPIT
ncbi:MAG: LLM class flavin-dependent oxidoreductase, partial [Actinobacteria bacterium]|nr:LLM class flavin-dependent oxidoreductase [Actinomycetota bacterium]